MASIADDSEKVALRRAALAIRRDARARLGGGGSPLVRSFPAQMAPPGTVVAGFWPIGDEIDCRPLMECLADQGCVTALPAVVARDAALDFRRWRTGDPLVPGPHRTFNPPPSSGIVEPDLLLVPLLAFDDRGGRLGYGGGYYDRTLEALRARRAVIAVGLAYSAQRVEKVPQATGDQRLDWIVTEEGAVKVER